MPHLLDVEVSSVLRGLELGRVITPGRAHQALNDYWAFVVERHELEPLGASIWDLRHQFTTYDAACIALAEGAGSPLVTCDRKLQAGGHRATVQLMARTADRRRRSARLDPECVFCLMVAL